MERYNHLNEYLKNKFGERTLKICVDGNFTCPNRDGSKGRGGCIFCGERGAGDNIKGVLSCVGDSIANQVKLFLNSYRGERANKFIVYFQNFSGTYDTIENLKFKFDKALSVSDKIVGLEIATRPDLISDEVVQLLASYKSKYYVCVELGLQTVNERVSKLNNLCYTARDFEEACRKLKRADIDVVAHIMVGLYGEEEGDIPQIVKFINNCGCAGVKIHSTYIMNNTELEKLYQKGEYIPITQEYYVDKVVQILSHLNPNIIIHRITADPPKDKVVAPLWTTHKKLVLNAINNKLKADNLYQGQFVD